MDYFVTFLLSVRRKTPCTVSKQLQKSEITLCLFNFQSKQPLSKRYIFQNQGNKEENIYLPGKNYKALLVTSHINKNNAWSRLSKAWE